MDTINFFREAKVNDAGIEYHVRMSPITRKLRTSFPVDGRYVLEIPAVMQIKNGHAWEAKAPITCHTDGAGAVLYILDAAGRVHTHSEDPHSLLTEAKRLQIPIDYSQISSR